MLCAACQIASLWCLVLDVYNRGLLKLIRAGSTDGRSAQRIRVGIAAQAVNRWVEVALGAGALNPPASI